MKYTGEIISGTALALTLWILQPHGPGVMAVAAVGGMFIAGASFYAGDRRRLDKQRDRK